MADRRSVEGEERVREKEREIFAGGNGFSDSPLPHSLLAYSQPTIPFHPSDHQGVSSPGFSAPFSGGAAACVMFAPMTAATTRLRSRAPHDDGISVGFRRGRFFHDVYS